MPIPAHLSPALGLLLTLAAAAPLRGQIASAAKVTVTGGAHPGTYTVESQDWCTIRPPERGEPGRFSIEMSNEHIPDSSKALTIFSVYIPSIESKHLGRLAASVRFDDLTNLKTPDTVYEMDTTPISELDSLIAREEGRRTVERKSSGRGRATLKRHGATATLAVQGETENGVRLEGTIECRRVERF